MKTTKRILMLSGLLALMAFTFSCGQNNNATPNPSKSDTVAVAAFPNQIGDSWTYSVFDSTTLKTQTVVVKITGDTIFSNNEKFKVWEYHYPDKIDTGYVNIVENTLNLNTKDSFYNTKYIFPLYPGKSWLSGIGGFYHNSTVEKIDTVTVPAGSFIDCYDIRTEIAANNYALIEDSWLKPKVGIIYKRSWEHNNGYFDIKIWKLVSYTLVN